MAFEEESDGKNPKKDLSMVLTRAPFPGESTGKAARSASGGQQVAKTGGAGLSAVLNSSATTPKVEASSAAAPGATDAGQANILKEHEKDVGFLLK